MVAIMYTAWLTVSPRFVSVMKRILMNYIEHRHCIMIRVTMAAATTQAQLSCWNSRAFVDPQQKRIQTATKTKFLIFGAAIEPTELGSVGDKAGRSATEK